MEITKKFGTTLVKINAETQKDAWKELAQAAEIFSETNCGLCASDDIHPKIREVQDGKKVHTYYELQCQKCRAKLVFGQHNEGDTLFPKRKLGKDGQPDQENGTYGKHNGWHKYVPSKEENKSAT